MEQLSEKFTRLKKAVGGNREQYQYEDTFGMPKEEQAHITPPTRANIRILSELEFAIHLNRAKGGAYHDCIDGALEYLLAQQAADGVLTNAVCGEAENQLAPLEAEAKTYKLILVGHAHLDMNWMWSYNETVADVLATFRTVLTLMEQYPQFRFSQSQAAVYKIVEEFDPEMMEEIKERIREGRWEVTATAWVEPDKNMPGTESMLRHIEYTREYLSETWGAKDFEIDFLPDTFGHNANVPEIDCFGGIKYFYHCRGLKEDYILYRYRAASGKELLAYKEPNWYNGAITPHIGAGLIGISEKCAGLKTGLVVYGVGDHGGGPTRRDIERALDMMTWKIYPVMEFGTMHQFFHEAEKVRSLVPVVDHEVNFFAPGCYTTQSRIKRGNRMVENSLLDADAMASMAKELSFCYPEEKMRKAWQNVLFTHFHDILTGSCVQDTREHAMGLYQEASAMANAQIQKAMQKITEQIDTSGIAVDIDAYNTQSEGAGAGYGIDSFSGVPSPERGSGKTRIFHIFNTLAHARREILQITVWDWIGDLRRIGVTDHQGNPLRCQMLDSELQQYWDHKYFRVLVEAAVPAMGYTTVILSETPAEEYPVYYQNNERVSRFYDDYVMSNGIVEARISASSGRIVSLKMLSTGEELIAKDSSAGLEYIETEAITSNAWQIGRYIRENSVEKCVKLETLADGPVRKQIRASYEIAASTAEVTYTLDLFSRSVRVDLSVDWHEIGKEVIPVLTYKVPLSYRAESFQYDIPAGAIRRDALANDVPGLQYGMAVSGNRHSNAFIVSDCKYGYRGFDDALSVSLINSATSPDPYPERGIQKITLFVGGGSPDCAQMENYATECCRPLIYVAGYHHHGSEPMEKTFVEASGDGIVITSVLPWDKGVIVRAYNTGASVQTARLAFSSPVSEAKRMDLNQNETDIKAEVRDREVLFPVEQYSIVEVMVTF